ncbi:MAG TPA: hypothetical protein VN900_04860 [Stellaceae bacterium]|jgi:hypothetical protein|nr:hypothetical protein [Stellaceae bacterium]
MNSNLAIRLPRRAIKAAFILCLVALAGWAGPSLAATPDQAPPLPTGQSRVWFMRQLLPGEAFHAPMIYVNGAPIAVSDEGTVFYRDFSPGQYAFTVENCLPQQGTGQTMTLRPDAQYALEITQDDNGAWDCVPPQVSYLRQVPPQQVPYVLAPLTFMGAM